jgi:hypothetical protein
VIHCVKLLVRADNFDHVVSRLIFVNMDGTVEKHATNVLEGLESEELPQNQNSQMWTDCTSFLSDVCSGLEIGEMLHHKTRFSLLDVMSVIEMMDPKMDSSYNTPRVRSVSERYNDGSLPPFESLSLRQIIYTMDRLFSSEVCE